MFADLSPRQGKTHQNKQHFKETEAYIAASRHLLTHLAFAMQPARASTPSHIRLVSAQVAMQG